MHSRFQGNGTFYEYTPKIAIADFNSNYLLPWAEGKLVFWNDMVRLLEQPQSFKTKKAKLA